jgi:SH3-like domain-containing protein
MRLGIIGTLLFLLFTPLAHSVCIKVEKANLRSGPGKDFPISWSVYRHMPFRQVGSSGSWIQLQDVDGDKHWAHSSVLSYTNKCAVIKVPRAYLRTGAGSKYKRVSYFPSAVKYTSFKYVKRYKNWVQLADDDNDKYWVYRKLVWIQ